ncbi:DUF3152 domain-containing protein [Streptomyces sp. NPDC089919]|uniref:DUF3152 domain-containing protein n=1 Tax=Streptomyces sp. NPDC089919 TaxID=3155188 RepID=UPI003439569A
MGRHSRKGPAESAGTVSEDAGFPDDAFLGAGFPADDFPAAFPAPAGAGDPAGRPGPVDPTVTHEGYTAPAHVRGGHPEAREPGGAWGEGAGSVYGDWRGTRRPAATAPARPADPFPPFEEPDPFTPRPHDTGSFPRPHDTGSFPRAQDTGSFRAVRDTGSFPQVHDTGSFEAVHDTGSFRAVHDTGAFPRVHDIGSFEAVRDTGSFEAVRETGSFPRVQDTGAFPRVHDTGSFEAFRDTGSFEAVRGTGAFPAVQDPGAPGADPAADPSAVPRPRREEDGSTTGTHRRPGTERRGRGKLYTGLAAAAVTAVLAVVVTGQVAGHESDRAKTSAAGDNEQRGGTASAASRSDERRTPSAPAVAPELSYDQKMAARYPIDPKLKGSGEFDTVPGVAAAPGQGRKVRYRVDVEKGLGLDGALFAEAVQRTLNDRRSWSHGGEMTFERVPSGEADFVITLASPGTTGAWCAKSGLDTTVDNVSCDSASTDRVMINAFRWAQGSVTYGADKMYAYRQMLINHEVGHRLGHGHVSCSTPGALAPIMQQQTKSLDIDGIKCRPNPWVYPGS